MNTERVMEDTEQQLREDCVDVMRERISVSHYPGYPKDRLTYTKGAVIENGRILLPDGPWLAEALQPGYDELTVQRIGQLCVEGNRIDQFGRPVHPWIEDLLIEDIGMPTGLGFYRKWGANTTVDPIVFRDDLDTRHVLMVVRGDNGKLALPGGFKEPGETAETGAAREAHEETGLNIDHLEATPVYSGVLTDFRATANAWPSTRAFRFDMPDDQAKSLPVGPWEGGDDALEALWVPVDKINELTFGSHRLLISLANELK